MKRLSILLLVTGAVIVSASAQAQMGPRYHGPGGPGECQIMVDCITTVAQIMVAQILVAKIMVAHPKVEARNVPFM